MNSLREDLSQIQGNLGKLLARYELSLPPDHRHALKADELAQMLEALDTAKARLDSIARIAAAQLEFRRVGSVARKRIPLSAQYETVAEAAIRTKITRQKLYSLLKAGGIPGAQLIGREWRIPAVWPVIAHEN